jgi:DNA-binding NarL/FixJ family response regulator
VTIRVLVADDQTLLRTALAGIVNTAPDMTVIGEAATGRQAVELAAKNHPDVVLMDIRMPEMDGLEATRQIATSSDSKVLILTTFDLDEYVYAALRNNASGFLLKDTPANELLHAIRVIAAGDALLAPNITRRLIQEFAARPSPNSPVVTSDALAAVTAREFEVLVLIGAGMSNQEIAQQLNIGYGTAKTHVGHLLTKLDARDRVQLVIIAHRAGLAPRVD